MPKIDIRLIFRILIFAYEVRQLKTVKNMAPRKSVPTTGRIIPIPAQIIPVIASIKPGRVEIDECPSKTFSALKVSVPDIVLFIVCPVGKDANMFFPQYLQNFD